MSVILMLCRCLLILVLLLHVPGCRGQAEEANKTPAKSFSPVKFVLDLLSFIRPEQPDTVKTLEEHADRFAEQKRDELAEKHYRLALTIRKLAWGDDHANVLPGLDKLIHFYILRERYADAAPLAEQALALQEKLSGDRHPDLLPRLQAYADILQHLQRTADAKAIEERIQALQQPNNKS